MMKNSPLLDNVLQRLRIASEHLDARDFRAELQRAGEDDARSLVSAVLRIARFLEDSVSTPGIGSPFELDTDSPVSDTMRKIANAYGVPGALPGTNGTSLLNVSATMSIAEEGEEILVSRDVHLSIINGLILSGAAPIYVVPPYDARFGLLPPTPAEIDAILRAHPRCKAVVLTRPSYTGLYGDIDGYVAVVHAHGARLLVDEAHAPHARFLHRLGFPKTAEEAGADLITLSVHKYLPEALNQASLLLINDLSFFDGRFRDAFQLGVSTSFSYPVLASLERAIERISHTGEQEWARAVLRVCNLGEVCRSTTGFGMLNGEAVDGVRVLGLDPARGTLLMHESGYTGYEVAGALAAAGVTVEMASTDQVILLFPPRDAHETDARLRAVLRGLEPRKRLDSNNAPQPPELPQRVLTPRAAFFARQRRMSVADAVGLVSCDTVSLFPPGRAVIVAGEVITQDVVDFIHAGVGQGAHLVGASDPRFEIVDVVDREVLS